MKQKGFTIIELMIVLAIIGLLTAIALPIYRDYTIKAKISEAIAVASSCKQVLTEMISTSDSANITAAVTGVCEPFQSQYVASMTTLSPGLAIVVILDATKFPVDAVKAGVNDMFMLQAAKGGSFLFPMDTNNDAGATPSAWYCGPGNVMGFFTGTNIQPKYLPANCK